MNFMGKLALIGSMAAFGAVIGGGLNGPDVVFAATMQQEGASDNEPFQTTEEAIASDAEWYANDQGVTLGEAIRRLGMQRQLGDLIDQIRVEYQDRLAGVVIEHQPEYRLRVRLTGSLPVRFKAVALGDGELPVEFETGAPATLAALGASIRGNQSKLARIYPTLSGIGIDEGTGEIVINVYAPNARAASIARAKLPAARALLRQAARIEITKAYPTVMDVRGGSRIVSSSSFLCTTAFVVKNSSGVTGVTTAGHCDNSETYYNPNGTSIPLTFVAGSEYLDSDQDVQVHTSSYAELPEFYWDDNKTTARILTGRRLKSSTAAGDNVCHRGETTGYSCGYVQQTNYAPYNPNDPLLCGGQGCAPVFVRVTGSTLECAGGDSGGPWFASTVAFGIHFAGSSSGPGPGQCAEAVYMSTDSITPGWTLLYGQ